MLHYKINILNMYHICYYTEYIIMAINILSIDIYKIRVQIWNEDKLKGRCMQHRHKHLQLCIGRPTARSTRKILSLGSRSHPISHWKSTEQLLLPQNTTQRVIPGRVFELTAAGVAYHGSSRLNYQNLVDNEHTCIPDVKKRGKGR